MVRCIRLLACVSVVALSGCATTAPRLQRLSLGMTKAQAVEAMGNPTAVRGALKNKYGQTIEVWEYTLLQGDGWVQVQRELNYWLYFVDDHLVQWGQAGDWRKEADRIYEIRFGSNTTLASP